MKKLWISFAVVLVVSFAVLGWIGTRIYQEMPPIPERVITTDGTVVIAQRRYRPRPECLAVAGRHGGGLDLGTRQLRRAGLDRRLAAPRSHLRPGRLGGRAISASLTTQLPAEEQGPAARAAGRNLPPQHLRCGHRRDPHRPGARPRLRKLPAALFRRLHERPRRLRDSRGQREHPGTHAAACGVHLLDLVGRRRPTGRTTTSPTPTTGRTSRWSAIARPAKRSSGPASASSCCWPASARMVWWYASQKTAKSSTAYCPPADPLGKWVATPSQRATLKYFWVVSR